MPVVTAVRKAQALDGRHEHIVGVCTADGTYHLRAEVASAIEGGEEWWSDGGDGRPARIHKAPFCPYSDCLTFPYLTTAPDHSRANDLENLPRC